MESSHYQYLDFSFSDTSSVTELFQSVFSNAEGQEEGDVIAGLVSNLISQTKAEDLFGYIAKKDKQIVGCVFFSRFTMPYEKTAFILSPMAISTEFQGRGIGQALILHSLSQLREKDVHLVITYGDPTFYSKVGFQQVTEKQIPAPYALSQPIGWLAQTLDGSEIPTVLGPTKCVGGLSDAQYW